MFRRLWNFAKRHRKKLLFTAACAGGAYYAWKIWLPRVQQQLLEKLLKESLELAKGEEEEKRRLEDRKANFAHKQQVSDAYVRKALAALQARHKELFAVEECVEKVKSAPTKEARLECFLQLQAECLSRLVSAMYVLHALLMLHRVEFNIVGRELSNASGGKAGGGAEPAEGAEAHAAFLETTRFLREEGVGQISDSARGAVRACLDSLGLSPTATVSAELLEKLFSDICSKVNDEFLPGSRAVSLFLPESVDQEVPEEHRPRVKPLVDEARDYLESPQFAEVFRTISGKAAKRLAGAFGDSAPDPAAAPLSGGQSCPLAKLNGQFIEISKTLLDEGNDSVARFAEEPVVDEFCQGLYFEDGSSAARK